MFVRCCAICVVIVVLTACISCSAGSSGPEIGTPAYYWQAARETFAAGDYNKTQDHLDKLIAGENQYVKRAMAWSLVMTSGLVGGYIDLADQYEAGARMNRSDPSAFRRQTSTNRTLAGRLSLQFAETYAKFEKSQGDTVPLAFGYPKGNAAPAPGLAKIAGGIVLPRPEIELIEQRTLERGILMAACAAAGAPGDTAKAETILKNPDATVPRAVFAVAVAQTLYNASQLYTQRKLDDPSKLTIFAERAQEALKTAPESKETKDLNAKIATALKKKKT
jgi:hypothetical protein